MKHILQIAALGSLIVVGGMADAHGRKGRLNEMSFEELDVNGDGKLTREDREARGAAMFAKADTDGDGVLSRAEIEAQGAERARLRVGKMIERLDTDGDGALSLEEMKAGREGRKGKRHGGKRGWMKRFDSNGDGAIDKAEFDAAKAKMAERRKTHKN